MGYQPCKIVDTKAAFFLFMAGLFSMTRIHLGGSIALTEIAMVLLSPIVFFKNLKAMRRDGMMPIIYLSVLWLLSALVSDCVNHTPLRFAMKGIATPVVTFSGLVCSYALLRRDLLGVRWFLLGLALSYVLSTFFLSRASSIEVEDTLKTAFEVTVEYKLYWLGILSSFLLLPTRGWYLQVPLAYSVLASLGLSAYALWIGARSDFAALGLGAVLILLGGKSKERIYGLRKHFFALVFLLLCIGLMFKGVYKQAVQTGFLGEKEAKKYEIQTRVGDSLLDMLMSGRVEFFVGLYASLKQPLLGRGSWAIDRDEIYPEFVYNYGRMEDYERFLKTIAACGRVWYIPFHTHIITYWMWHGILALFFWSYVLYLAISTICKRLYVIPELMGYLSLALPSFLWDIFFSPYGDRVAETMLFSILVLVKQYERFNGQMLRSDISA